MAQSDYRFMPIVKCPVCGELYPIEDLKEPCVECGWTAKKILIIKPKDMRKMFQVDDRQHGGI